MSMKVSPIERAVIEAMLADRDLKPVLLTVDFDAVTVIDREFSGVGFLTECERSDVLKLFGNDVFLRWGNVGARLNASKLETGYIVYVDNGYVTGVEGFTYGEPWPDVVKEFELYELHL
jgi:hypothetical protein